MAGLIFVDETRVWSVSNWVFNQAMELVQKHLPTKKTNNNLLELIVAAQAGLNYIPLDKLSRSDFIVFCEAIKAAYLEAKSHGDKLFVDTEFYPNFMERLKELLDLLEIPLSQSQSGGDVGHRD